MAAVIEYPLDDVNTLVVDEYDIVIMNVIINYLKVHNSSNCHAIKKFENLG